ncbi:hypothetical protein CYMTET_30398, partial [Cymbomonas tetramitiformis]
GQATGAYTAAQGQANDAYASAQGQVQGVQNQAGAAVADVQGQATGAYTAAQGQANDAYASAQGQVQGVQNQAGAAGADVQGQATGAYTAAQGQVQDIQNQAGAAVADVQGQATGAYTAAQGQVQQGFEQAQSWESSITNTLTHEVSGIADQGHDLMDNANTGLDDVVSQAESYINSAMNFDYTSWGGSEVPAQPMMYNQDPVEHGGLVGGVQMPASLPGAMSDDEELSHVQQTVMDPLSSSYTSNFISGGGQLIPTGSQAATQPQMGYAAAPRSERYVPKFGGLPATIEEHGAEDTESEWSSEEERKATEKDYRGKEEWSYGIIHFGSTKVQAPYVIPPRDMKAGDVLNFLLDFWGISLPKLVLSIIGSSQPSKVDARIGLTQQNVSEKITQLFARGICRGAMETGAWMISNGINSGIGRCCGQVGAVEALAALLLLWKS